jgi:predicted outer membrane repeat protein
LPSLIAVALAGCSGATPGGTGGAGGTGGTPTACTSASDCDDGNECTEDTCDCDATTCGFTSRSDGALCSDGLCEAGACAPIASTFPCTQEGILDAIAEGGGPHAFECDGRTQVVTDGTITIDNDVVLDGLDALIVEGNDADTVFVVAEGVTVELRRLTVTRGGASGIANGGNLTMTECEVSGNTTGQFGGGIFSDGTLSLRDCIVSGNMAGDSGGGIAALGAITVTKTIFSANLAENVGGGIFWADGEATASGCTVANNMGGGIWNQATLTMTDSVVVANAATNESGIGGVANLANFTLTRSTISDNEARSAGLLNQGTMTMVQSTVSRNRSTAAVGSGVGGGITSVAGSVAVINSTISANTTTDVGAGVFALEGTLTLHNSTIAENVAENGFDAIAANPALTVTNSVISGECGLGNPIVSSGSIESPGDTCGLNVMLSGEALGLGPLRDNGGPTQTHALEAGSEALDAVDECLGPDGEPLTVDQRGEARPQGPACDVGAFELGASGGGGDGCTPEKDDEEAGRPFGFVTTEVGSTPLRGNTGGGSLASDRCPVGQVLSGFSHTTNVSVDGLAVRCSILSLRELDDGSFSVHTTVPRPIVLEGPPRGRLDPEPDGFNCADGHALTGFSGNSGFLIDALTLRCTPLEVVFDGDYEIRFGDPVDFDAMEGTGVSGPFPQTDCPAGQVASGADIRSGDGIDAIGFRCSTPTLIH